jgi:hypothetical protein
MHFYQFLKLFLELFYESFYVILMILFFGINRLAFFAMPFQLIVFIYQLNFTE